MIFRRFRECFLFGSPHPAGGPAEEPTPPRLNDLSRLCAGPFAKLTSATGRDAWIATGTRCRFRCSACPREEAMGTRSRCGRHRGSFARKYKYRSPNCSHRSTSVCESLGQSESRNALIQFDDRDLQAQLKLQQATCACDEPNWRKLGANTIGVSRYFPAEPFRHPKFL